MSQRYLNWIAFFCFFALAFALISQHVFNILPCAWCVLQRLIVLIIGALCLLGNVVNKAILIQRLVALFSAALALCGVAVAWYQSHVAAKLFTCDMTFADRFMARTTHLDSTLPWLFGIYASCMDAVTHILGVEYATWGLLLFGLIFVLAVMVLFTKTPAKTRPSF